MRNLFFFFSAQERDKDSYDWYRTDGRIVFQHRTWPTEGGCYCRCHCMAYDLRLCDWKGSRDYKRRDETAFPFHPEVLLVRVYAGANYASCGPGVYLRCFVEVCCYCRFGFPAEVPDRGYPTLEA